MVLSRATRERRRQRPGPGRWTKDRHPDRLQYARTSLSIPDPLNSSDEARQAGNGERADTWRWRENLLWNAVALRMSQRDFKGRQHDGAGEDWPLKYGDLAPYYDRIEREVGVCGNSIIWKISRTKSSRRYP